MSAIRPTAFLAISISSSVFVLYDSKNGDFDTVAVHYVETSDGNRIGIHKYFRPANEDEPEFPNWKEINIVDYVERKKEYDKRGGSVK